MVNLMAANAPAPAPAFEITLHYPADPAQPLLPSPQFSRNSTLGALGKHAVAASSPLGYGGDGTRYNPEEFMLMSLSQCHMLTYLAIAAKKQMTILNYEDRATGELGMGKAGGVGVVGKMSMQRATLRPRVTVPKGTNVEDAIAMHVKAHANCFMANSVNFPVETLPEVIEAA
jgi:organic hydroperoxide reductase OsmC/OhrA